MMSIAGNFFDIADELKNDFSELVNRAFGGARLAPALAPEFQKRAARPTLDIPAPVLSDLSPSEPV